MIGAVQSLKLETVEDRWVRYLRALEVEKVGVYRQSRIASTPNPLYSILDQCIADPPFEEALVTYLGFQDHPTGLLFRKLQAKEFKFVPLKTRKLSYYVAQDFEVHAHRFSYGLPIVLVEGVLDAESFAKTVQYPYVMAYLTSYVNTYVAAFVASITNRVLLVPDNDDAGRNGAKRSIKNFKEFGVGVKEMKTIEKDFGDVFANKNTLDIRMAYQMLQLAR